MKIKLFVVLSYYLPINALKNGEIRPSFIPKIVSSISFQGLGQFFVTISGKPVSKKPINMYAWK